MIKLLTGTLLLSAAIALLVPVVNYLLNVNFLTGFILAIILTGGLTFIIATFFAYLEVRDDGK